MLKIKAREIARNRKFIGIYEAAAYCNLCYKSFKRGVDAGMIPYRKIGRAYRFSVENLDQWMKGNDSPYKDDAGSRF